MGISTWVYQELCPLGPFGVEKLTLSPFTTASNAGFFINRNALGKALMTAIYRRQLAALCCGQQPGLQQLLKKSGSSHGQRSPGQRDDADLALHLRFVQAPGHQGWLIERT